MSRNTTRSGNERLKYGICLNDECSKCRSKEVQSVPMRKDLVCSECGKELRECPPPRKKGKPQPIYIGLGVVLCIGALIGGVLTFSTDSTKEARQNTTDVIAVIDTPKVEPVEVAPTPTEVAKEPVVQPQKTTPTNGTLRLSYGTYTGATKNGYPHGQGRLTYSTSRQINRNDMKERTAKAGDYVIGEFFNGFVVYGKHYDSSGNLLGSLNFGVGAENSYDSK